MAPQIDSKYADRMVYGKELEARERRQMTGLYAALLAGAYSFAALALCKNAEDALVYLILSTLLTLGSLSQFCVGLKRSPLFRGSVVSVVAVGLATLIYFKGVTLVAAAGLLVFLASSVFFVQVLRRGSYSIRFH